MQRNKKRKIIRAAAAAMCGITVAGSAFAYSQTVTDNSPITAYAVSSKAKDFKWTKKAVSEGTTVDASYLWPDETNPAFTKIYRDGKLVNESKMVTITAGSVYSFHGSSDDSILYTQVYVGYTDSVDVTSGEIGTYYMLLPSSIRSEFEGSGWTWEIGSDSSDRAVLNMGGKTVTIKANDPSAVLYGMGLYLDVKNSYTADAAFTQEKSKFLFHFGYDDNMYSTALEAYFTRSGELKSKCPKIYAMVADTMSQLDDETTKVRKETLSDSSDTSSSSNSSSSGSNNSSSTNSSSNSSSDSSNSNSNSSSDNSSNSSSSNNSNTNSSASSSSTTSSEMKELLSYVNSKRAESGLPSVKQDTADNENIAIRVKEVAGLNSQTRPNGSDAFTAYTDEVMTEVRMVNPGSVENIYENAASYFQMSGLESFNYASYGDVAVLIFVW